MTSERDKTHPDSQTRSLGLAAARLLYRLSLAIAACGWAAMLLRPVPLVWALACAVTFGCAALGLRAYALRNSAPSISWTARASSAILIALSVLFSVLIVEAGARLILPRTPNISRIFENDPEYLFLPKPDSRGGIPIRLEDGTSKWVDLAISSQGLRDREVPPKEPGEFRIAMLGDSHAMGHAVQADDAYPHQTEIRLRSLLPGRKVLVFNAGASGAGPLQELGMLRKRALPLNPDLVVLQVFPGNDIENALEPTEKHQRAYDILTRFHLADCRNDGLYRRRIEKWMWEHSRAYQALRLATKRRIVADTIGQFRFAAPPEAKLPPSETRPFWLEVNLKNWYPELEEGFERLKEGIRTMRDECAARGVAFAVFCMPDNTDVSDENWRLQTREANPPVEYERTKALRLTEAFLKQEGIPTISVLDALRAAGPINKVYYVADGHLTEMGNTVVANVLAEYIATQCLPRVPDDAANPVKAQK